MNSPECAALVFAHSMHANTVDSNDLRFTFGIEQNRYINKKQIWTI